VIFGRDAFFNLNFDHIDPIQAIQAFDPVIEVTKSGDLKTITPLE
jgi:hypothetical protein